uniref:Uncharacterized protein n=1 Tax=Proboscia inermis TaxID=420281 RepID=A0A7S0GL13_9STRA|mmetsp:Transcript_48582/g.48943  ORF Transcript_48582/g.48943 Transcript_48582/m.48943 type:complete len:218 (+) Transcript_48582:377-1030(+)
MIFGSFLLFVPAYVTSVYGYTPTRASTVGSVFSLGCLGSVMAGSKWYAQLFQTQQGITSNNLNCNNQKRITVTLGLGGLSILCALSQLLHCSSTKVASSWIANNIPIEICMLFWGASFSIPFYIPSSIYALEQGGRGTGSSNGGVATIADAFDLVGFGLLAWFNGIVVKRIGSMQEISRSGLAWVGTMKILTGCATVSLVSLLGVCLLMKEKTSTHK